MSANAIPKPNFPTRQRRSAIAQAAQAAGAPTAPPKDANPDPDQSPPETPAATARSTPRPPKPAAVSRTVAAAAAAPPAPAVTSLKRLGGRSKDILLTLPEEEKERMVNTIAWTSPHTGITHQSRFIRYAIAKYCAELEEKFNNGQPFTPPASPEM